MIIRSLKLTDKILIIEASVHLAVKLMAASVNVNSTNHLTVRKNKLVSDVLEPLAANSHNVDEVIEKSFLALTHKYNVDPLELAGWAFLHGKIQDDATKLKCAKYFTTVFKRSLNLYPDLKTDVIKLLKQYRTLAKKQGDSDYYDSLKNQLHDVAA